LIFRNCAEVGPSCGRWRAQPPSYRVAGLRGGGGGPRREPELQATTKAFIPGRPDNIKISIGPRMQRMHFVEAATRWRETAAFIVRTSGGCFMRGSRMTRRGGHPRPLLGPTPAPSAATSAAPLWRPLSRRDAGRGGGFTSSGPACVERARGAASPGSVLSAGAGLSPRRRVVAASGRTRRGRAGESRRERGWSGAPVPAGPRGPRQSAGA
jgi:hypothetical protein